MTTPVNYPSIIFMGTPEFAVPSLEILVKNNYPVKAVVTMPDKPSGRGQKLSESAVKKFAVEAGIKVLQPEKLKDPLFIKELQEIGADLFIVVAFRMLPELIWNMPASGTFNLHASLLPQYRGAAPINWAIINGENKSGVTSFFLKHAIDTGNIILQEEETIDYHDTAGTLHDKLMLKGASLVLRTVQLIASNNIQTIEQSALMNSNIPLKTAPKIFKEDCRINFNQPAESVRNFIRGLSPYPGAFFELENPEKEVSAFKIFNVSMAQRRFAEPGTLKIVNNKEILVSCADWSISIEEIQMSGKKRMKTSDFLLGHTISDTYRII